MKISRFKEFLTEKEIALSKSIEEYVVNDMGNGKFTVTLDNIEKQFSVLPLPKDKPSYEKLFQDLNAAINSKQPATVYKVIKEAEVLPYKFGNLLNNSLSLSNVQGLAVGLTEDQQRRMKSSEEEFIKTDFTTLSKSLRIEVMKYLYETAKMYAICLEAMFYYMRTGDAKEFYDSSSFDDILKQYDTTIKHKLPDAIGPTDDKGAAIEAKVDHAFWQFEYKGKKMFLQATTSPEMLNSEEHIAGKKGLSLTLLDDLRRPVSKNTTAFSIEDFDKIFKSEQSE